MKQLLNVSYWIYWNFALSAEPSTNQLKILQLVSISIWTAEAKFSNRSDKKCGRHQISNPRGRKLFRAGPIPPMEISFALNRFRETILPDQFCTSCWSIINSSQVKNKVSQTNTIPSKPCQDTRYTITLGITLSLRCPETGPCFVAKLFKFEERKLMKAKIARVPPSPTWAI